MSDNKSPLEALFEGLDKGLLNEEVKSKLTTLINETVDVRVSAKEKLLTEEVEALKTKLTTESETLKKTLTEEAENNEKVLVEQAEKYKKELEETVVQETLKYKEFVEKQRDDEIAKHRSEVEAAVLEEAKNFKNQQDAALVEEVKKFKTAMVDKVSDYLEAKLQETIPAEIMESAAELAVIKPLVNGINEIYSKNFIKLDTTGYKLMKDAKDEIVNLKEQLQEKSKVEVALKKEKREVERNFMIKSLTEGLTSSQKDKANKLLESVELENLETHFKKIRDIVIESPKNEATKVTPKVEKLEEANKPATQKSTSTPIAEKAVVEHQVTKVINLLKETDDKSKVGSDSKKVNESANPQIHSWATKIKPSYIEETPKK